MMRVEPGWIPVCLVFIIKVVHSLRIVSLDIPRNVEIGQKVELMCYYDLGEDQLYSIKWYRDNIEFFRYMPGDRPHLHYFPIEGIKVDLRKSSKNSVYLYDVGALTEGKFSCEVSGDTPGFRTVSASKRMTVGGTNNESSATFQLSSIIYVVSSCLVLLPLHLQYL
ncbi:uncharacterized protein LOC106459612 [Limulus polyphemus]|uniref:Uncharacterized protein LOC106459612 n=1 Tax=Limulus polyphemus TaxID=6850 RepID=A0ABM1B4K2_LIMPO|nr:uncharacterized protein LOC106459612 [Limulus polyphemus]